MITKIERRIKIKHRVRNKVSGTAERPRLSVFRSNKQIYAQIIDDTYVNKEHPFTKRIVKKGKTILVEDYPMGKTLVSASCLGMGEMSKSEQSVKVGELIAKKALEAGITKVVFDRNGYLFHGRVKQLADAARNGGLVF